MKKYVELMLDSGVFSAWNRGVKLDIKAYIKWIREHERYLFSYVSMDVMPGKFGHKLSREQVEASALGSYKQHQIMLDAGLAPIPVYHQGEDLKHLERYLRDGEPYIGLSTSKETMAANQARWLDRAFTLLTDERGRPLVRTHGFGITRPSLLFRYPWYSTDSTTWTLTPSFGQLWIPPFANGKPDYSTPPMQVIMSELDIVRKARNRDFGAIAHSQPLIRQCILDYLKYCGFGLEEARYDPNVRRRIMLRFFSDLREEWYVKNFAHRMPSIGLEGASEIRTKPVRAWDQLNIMLATNLSRSWAVMMNECGSTQRLLNYFELKDRPSEDLINFVMDGKTGDPRDNPIRADWRSRYTTHRRLQLVKRIEADNAEE